MAKVGNAIKTKAGGIVSQGKRKINSKQTRKATTAIIVISIFALSAANLTNSQTSLSKLKQKTSKPNVSKKHKNVDLKKYLSWFLQKRAILASSMQIPKSNVGAR